MVATENFSFIPMVFKRIFFISLLLNFCQISYCQKFEPGDIPADSWAKVLREKKGTISALWYDIEPFIYRTGKGGMAGVEYEFMEAFVAYLRSKYQIDLRLKWVDAKSFENIYPYISKTKKNAVFGWSYYSITEERKDSVKFTPPYMPDVNIVVTDMDQPTYATNEDFIKSLPGKKAYTMSATMMERDVYMIKQNFAPTLSINKAFDDYAVMERIANEENAFGYVPLSIYVMALQKGIKVKRQSVLTSRREGFAAIYPKSSDWDSPVNEYFSSKAFADLSVNVIRKYLGNEVTDLIFKASLPDSVRSIKDDNELLTLEKEIISQNLLDSVVASERKNMILNIILAAIVVILIFMFILYILYASRKKYAHLLKERNVQIIKQKEEIEKINKQLEAKVQLAEMNPHLVFNSLNALQYFIDLDSKKNALNYLSGFSKLLRMIIENASSIRITIDKEIKLLKQYLEMEQIRFEQKFSYNIITPKNNAALLCEIPSQIIQPIAESIIYTEILPCRQSNPFIHFEFDIHSQYSVIKIHFTCDIQDPNQEKNNSNTSLVDTIKKIKARTELHQYGNHKLDIGIKDNADKTAIIHISIQTMNNQ